MNAASWGESRCGGWFVWLIIGFALGACAMLAAGGCSKVEPPKAALQPPIVDAEPVTSGAQSAKLVRAAPGPIPRDAERYRRDLVRSARLEWGLDAPVAMMGAQIHQESGWRANARSPVGAEGLAQFMPTTGTWLAGVRSTVGPADPYNPTWALRALAAYDRMLWDGSSAIDECNHAAFTLSAYNGGNGNLNKDIRLCKASGCIPSVWWDHVEKVNAGRNAAAFAENRSYPRRILLTLEPRYVAAGWSAGICTL